MTKALINNHSQIILKVENEKLITYSATSRICLGKAALSIIKMIHLGEGVD